MSVWLDKPRRHLDGRHKSSGLTTMRSASQNFAVILSCFEPHPDGVALSSGRLHFSCTQFPYQGFTRPDQGNGRLDSWLDERNFHISSSRVQTMKANNVRTSEFWMRDLPYGMSASGRESTSSGRLQRSSHICVSKRNLIAGRTLSVVRTCYWNVRTDASWYNSKLLDIEEGLDGKFSSSGQMMLWTVGFLDGISCRADGCCLTDERPDGIPRRPDGCKGSDNIVLKSVQNLL
jgi:hypothetical protein